ncbi:hypothetical protein F5B20DRAFT_157727 [Whalleya microplaca]|nr:hypothetical protein F5B20DRAFT_157727 [Whalleya microplaca]
MCVYLSMYVGTSANLMLACTLMLVPSCLYPHACTLALKEGIKKRKRPTQSCPAQPGQHPAAYYYLQSIKCSERGAPNPIPIKFHSRQSVIRPPPLSLPPPSPTNLPQLNPEFLLTINLAVFSLR